MKILLYSDLHISRTSSIMPMLSDSKYTYRQDMIMKTGKYLADIIDTEEPDLIINLGDTFDQHTITSYDVDVASKFFECFRMFNIPHLVLVGNHEMVNSDFNAVEILGNINNITVITEPCTVNTNFLLTLTGKNIDSDTKLAFLPYCNYKDILEFPEGDFLFSHNDIQGSSIRGDFVLPDGIDQNTLKTKYKLVFNGHIHKPSIMNNIVNVGSVSTHSFSDDDNSVPQCYIFNTETLDLKTFKPTICPLFRKFNIQNDLSELENYINTLDKNYKYILHILCPFEIKDTVKTYLESVKDIVIANRLNVKVQKATNENNEVVNTNLQSNVDIKQTFTDFLETIDLKFPKELYLEVLKEVQ